MHKESKFVVIAFFVILSVYLLSPITHYGDMKWIIHVAYSMLHEGNTRLDDYVDPELAKSDYTLVRIKDHYYSVYPIGTAMVALPFVAAMDFVESAGKRIFPGTFDSIRSRFLSRASADMPLMLAFHDRFGKFIASLITALAGVVLYRLCRLYTGLKESFLLLFLFAFCTSAFSTASRALWQHGPSILMLTLACYLLLSGIKKRSSIIQYSSLPLSLAVIIRPLNVISFVFIALFVFAYYRRFFSKFLLWSLLIAIPFLWYNLGIYQHIMPSYYQPGKFAGIRTPFWAFWGNLISPARGLLVYSPIFMFSFLGLFRQIRTKQAAAIDYFFMMILIMHLVLLSAYPHWWGGWSYGPRYMADMIPFLIYFMIPVFQYWQKVRFRRLLAAILCLTIIISFFMHIQGATSIELGDWNSTPIDVDKHPERLWDWSDPPFLRNFR